MSEHERKVIFFFQFKNGSVLIEINLVLFFLQVEKPVAVKKKRNLKEMYKNNPDLTCEICHKSYKAGA